MDNVKKQSGFFAFLKKNIVAVIALFAAVVTSIIVPPDKAYLDYFDYKTLTCLFCVLAVVCALKNIRFFYLLARKCVELFKNARMSVLALVYITFIGSMLIANDMALLTFLPLGFLVLTTTGKQKYMAFTFIMQNIAANLGGMLTPFGNPQNLYLYNFFRIPNLAFMGIMAPPFVLSILLITACCILFVKPERFSASRADGDLPCAVCLFHFHRLPRDPLLVGTDRHSALFALYGQTGAAAGRLSLTLHLCLFLHLFGKHGAHRRCTGVFLLPSR